eukprot:12431474-Karenia_brevis.AAC.1
MNPRRGSGKICKAIRYFCMSKRVGIMGEKVRPRHEEMTTLQCSSIKGMTNCPSRGPTGTAQ